MFNVLHFISDQHLASCMGCEGHAQALTPNMDRLAASGVRFTRAYTQNPICTPSRVSILSGQYPHNHGYYGLGGPAPARLPHLLGHFAQNGYRTAAIGKLHVPDQPKAWMSDDIDLFADGYYGLHHIEGDSPYFDYLRERGLYEREDSLVLPELPGVQQHEARPSLLNYEDSIEGWSVRVAQEFIEQSGDKPWCMQLSLPRPHQCYSPDRQFWEMYSPDLSLPPTLDDDASHRPPHFQSKVREYKQGEGLIEPRDFRPWARRVWRGYLACITQVDYGLGQMLDFLEARGQLENTIVIYGSDHGAYSGTFGVPEKAPGICSEAVCRVPFIWRVPGVTQSGSVCEQLVENIDIAPTVSALCQLPPLASADGVDISPLLRGENQPVREIAVTENVWSKAVRWHNWRFVHYQREMWGEETGELYDLAADPDETRNLYNDPSHQATLNECRRLLLEWLIRTSRFVTAFPSAEKLADGDAASALAGDGKESNQIGIAARIDGEMTQYYL